jgi:hypothetical protein
MARVRFMYVTCLSMNCLVYAQSPTNPYLISMNVSLSEIEIGGFISTGFDPAWIDSANAALIFISNINQISVVGFFSADNRNLAILNINNVQQATITDYSCFSTPQDLDSVIIA